MLKLYNLFGFLLFVVAFGLLSDGVSFENKTMSFFRHWFGSGGYIAFGYET